MSNVVNLAEWRRRKQSTQSEGECAGERSVRRMLESWAESCGTSVAEVIERELLQRQRGVAVVRVDAPAQDPPPDVYGALQAMARWRCLTVEELLEILLEEYSAAEAPIL